MKVITIKKKNIMKTIMILVFICMIGIFSTSLAMQHYYKVDFSTGLVTATELNVRSGPGTGFRIIATIKKMSI